MAEIDPLIANDDLPPSKSELKRQMAERQKLAEALSALTSDALKSIPIDEDLRDAIAQTSKVRSFEGIRRHKQYLGKRMRALSDEDIAAIKKQLEVIEGPGRVETAKLHRLERLRERLLQSDEALQELITKYPALDIQSIRTLIRNAKKEREAKTEGEAASEMTEYLLSLALLQQGMLKGEALTSFVRKTLDKV